MQIMIQSKHKGADTMKIFHEPSYDRLSDFFVPFSARGIDDMCQMFILKTNFQVR